MLSRRQFLGTVATVPVLAALPQRALASTGPRELKFLHTHTGERLAVEYFDAHDYIPDALATVNHFLRDFRTGDEHPIDPTLLDLLVQPPAAFLRNYIAKGGVRDGAVGFVISTLNAYYVFLKFAKLWELQRQSKRPAA